MAITAVVNTTETVANANVTIVANSFQVTNLTIANGSVVRLSVSGVAVPGTFGSTTFPPAVTLRVAAGANGNAQDATLSTISFSPNQTALNGGAFSADFLFTCRGNAKAQGSATSNQAWTAAIFDPVGQITNPSSNGAVNVQLGSANTANLTLLASVGDDSRGAVVLIEQVAFVQTV